MANRFRDCTNFGLAGLTGAVLAVAAPGAFAQTASAIQSAPNAAIRADGEPPTIHMPPPVTPGVPHPPVPASNPASWVGNEDYPQSALISNSMGIVGFELHVAANGIPDGCEILKSSHDPELDSTTCDLLLKRAQFRPAHDAGGKAIAGTYRSSVRWQIPEAPLPVAGRYQVTFDILPDGTMTNCTASATGDILVKMPAIDPQAACKRTVTYSAPVDANGKPVKQHVVYDANTTVTDVP